MSHTPTLHRFSEFVYSRATRLLSSSLSYVVAPLLIVLSLAPDAAAQSGVRAYILGVRTVGSTENQVVTVAAARHARRGGHLPAGTRRQRAERAGEDEHRDQQYGEASHLR